MCIRDRSKDRPGRSDGGFEHTLFHQRAAAPCAEHHAQAAPLCGRARQSGVQPHAAPEGWPEVELILNGKSLGVKKGVYGIFTWTEIQWKKGENILTARSKDNWKNNCTFKYPGWIKE